MDNGSVDSALPEGFVLDSPSSSDNKSDSSTLPEGFVLDNPDSNNQDKSAFSKSEPDPFAENIQSDKPSNPNSTGRMIEDISGDVARGALNSAAGTVDKINGAVKLLKDLTQFDAGSQNLSHVSDALRQSATGQAQSDNPMVSGAAQFLGSIPDALAEFAGTGGGVGFVARSAALSAADEYNKSQNAGSLIKGAVVGGTVGAALNAIPGVVDSTAKVAKEWGETAGKKYWKAVTGGTEEQADDFIKNINTFELNPKVEVPDYYDAKNKANEEVAALRSNNNDIVAKQKEQNNEEYSFSKEASAKAVQDLARENDGIIETLKDVQTADKINIVRANTSNLMAANDSAVQKLSDATSEQVNTIANAKNALSTQLVSVFDTAAKKLEAMQQGVTDNITMAHAALDKNNLSYVQMPVLQFELDNAIKEGAGKFYKMQRSSDGKSVALFGTEGTNTPAVHGALNLINSVRANLVNDFMKSGKTSLAAIEANSAILEGAISKGFKGEALPKNVAEILSNIKKSITPSKLYAKYPEELSHLKPLADANKAYATQIDGMRGALDLYKDNVDSTINPDRVFKALDRNDTGYIAKLKQADAALPPQDRIFGQVKNAYDNFKFVEKSEKTNLSKIEKQVSEQRVALRNKFDDMEQKLSLNQRKEMSQVRQGSSYKEKDLSNQERKRLADLHYHQKQGLAMIKAQKDKELATLQKSLDDRLKFLHIQSMARGSRANPSGTMRIVQNVGEYHSISGVMAGKPMDVLKGLLINKFASPSGVSRLIKDAINAPNTTGPAKSVANNKILKRIVATKASGR